MRKVSPVGDEDQTLYGWRRASVRRIIDLDLSDPGLQRVSLTHNYRCPNQVVDASGQLIEHNKVRFPKSIHANPDRPTGDGEPEQAQPDDVALVCRAPSRGLPFGSEERAAMSLQGGLRFTESLAGVPANIRSDRED